MSRMWCLLMAPAHINVKNVIMRFQINMGSKRYNKRPVRDWNDLKQGDCVRVVGGSGSYYVSPETGERTYMSSKGKYKVHRITARWYISIWYWKE